MYHILQVRVSGLLRMNNVTRRVVRQGLTLENLSEDGKSVPGENMGQNLVGP